MDNHDYDTYIGPRYNKLFAVLSYFGVLWVLGLVIHPEADDPYVKENVNNAIILTILQTLMPLINLVPILGWLVYILWQLVFVVFWLICVISALTGSTFKLPVLSDRFRFAR